MKRIASSTLCPSVCIETSVMGIRRRRDEERRTVNLRHLPFFIRFVFHFFILFFPSFLQLELREAFSFVRVNFGRIAMRFSSFTSLFPIPSGFPICICFFKCSSSVITDWKLTGPFDFCYFNCKKR